MRIFKIAEDFEKIRDFFEKRTKYHINLVQKYCKKIEEYDEKRFKGLSKIAEKHDSSKFEDPEINPYIYITWKYKCQKEGWKFESPENMDEMMNEAIQHHVSNNNHHPEKHCNRDDNLINENDRDKPPSKIVDATKMPDIAIAEMCADWMAVAEEKETKVKDWADKNVNIRWKFNKDQKELIYELIEKIS